jgi:hypothetical protein
MEIISKSGPLTVYRNQPLNWSAIFGGWVVATGVAWLLYVLGLAVGFSAVDLSHAETMTKAWGIGTRAWLVLTWAASLFMGGLFASWVDGKAHPTFGVLNGVAVLGLATTITVLMLSLGFANTLQGGASLLSTRSANPVAAIQQPLNVAANPEQASTQEKEKAERVARYTAAALWALFFSTIAGAFAAVLGGWVGSGHLHNVYDDAVARATL